MAGKSPVSPDLMTVYVFGPGGPAIRESRCGLNAPIVDGDRARIGPWRAFSSSEQELLLPERDGAPDECALVHVASGPALLGHLLLWRRR